MARVLAVDEEPSMLLALKTLLDTRATRAVVAHSGAEVLERLDGVDAVASSTGESARR